MCLVDSDGSPLSGVFFGVRNVHKRQRVADKGRYSVVGTGNAVGECKALQFQLRQVGVSLEEAPR